MQNLKSKIVQKLHEENKNITFGFKCYIRSHLFTLILILNCMFKNNVVYSNTTNLISHIVWFGTESRSQYCRMVIISEGKFS